MINFELTEEQRLLEQSVREWGAREVAPKHSRSRSRTPVRQVADHRRHEDARSARHLRAAAVRRRRDGLPGARHRQRGARIRRHLVARDHVGARRPQLPVAAHLGHRSAEAEISRAAGAGREARDLWPDRAVGRQRRARHSDDGREEGRSLGAQRREDVDLARRRRRQLPGVCLVRCREEEAARSRPASAASSSSARSRAFRAAR